MSDVKIEQWVDLKELAKHLGFGYQATRKMVIEGKIPGTPLRNGKKTFWIFKKSIVDAYLANQGKAA